MTMKKCVGCGKDVHNIDIPDFECNSIDMSVSGIEKRYKKTYKPEIERHVEAIKECEEILRLNKDLYEAVLRNTAMDGEYTEFDHLDAKSRQEDIKERALDTIVNHTFDLINIQEVLDRDLKAINKMNKEARGGNAKVFNLQNSLYYENALAKEMIDKHGPNAK